MATVIATIALAVTPMLDSVEQLVERVPVHHHRQRPRRHDPPMSVALASYYSYPAGASTACGFSSPVGVANRSLPCGTHVRFCAARCVVGIVDDRGPYIYSRLWDLSVGLAEAIGFNLSAGVAPVRWAID